jgi:K+-transporting ATPase ATPase A chain
MNIYRWLQLILYIVVLIALAKPLGSFMAKVCQDERSFPTTVLRPKMTDRKYRTEYWQLHM